MKAQESELPNIAIRTVFIPMFWCRQPLLRYQAWTQPASECIWWYCRATAKRSEGTPKMFHRQFLSLNWYIFRFDSVSRNHFNVAFLSEWCWCQNNGSVQKKEKNNHRIELHRSGNQLTFSNYRVRLWFFSSIVGILSKIHIVFIYLNILTTNYCLRKSPVFESVSRVSVIWIVVGFWKSDIQPLADFAKVFFIFGMRTIC